MKIVIDIPKEFEEHFNKDRFSDSLARVASDIESFGFQLAGRYEQETITMIRKAFEQATPLEAQPNRCDSCTHSEEQDGSNCYECVKGMADNFEAQPTDAVWRSDVEYIIKGSLCDLRRNEDKRIFINTLNSLPSVIPQKMQGKWIPTTERLPDNNQTEYLVTYKRKGKLWINIGFCDDGDWYLYSNDEGPNWEPYVIAWMPLPEPYKREDDEE